MIGFDVHTRQVFSHYGLSELRVAYPLALWGGGSFKNDSIYGAICYKIIFLMNTW